jgi:cell division protein ZipA
MANLTNPGTFDKAAWNTLETKGVTMFMTLPGPKNALDAWDSMLATSRRLAELLHADLLDDELNVFTRQRSLQIKEELREYERQKNDQS